MNRKEEIRELWRTCFHDTEEFIAFYFEHIFKEEQAVTLESEGRIVSFLQIIPYSLLWRGKEWTTGYISGACTLPAERGKGRMRELLQKAFREMRKKRYDLTALIPAEPWLFDYYRREGYTEVFDYVLKTYTKKSGPEYDLPVSLCSLDRQPEDIWYRYFDRKLRERGTCILHTQEDFHRIITDILLGGGHITGAMSRQGEPTGLAFFVPGKEEFFVKEVLYDSEEILQAFLREASGIYHMKKGSYKLPPSLPDADPKHLGMAMILNKDGMIGHGLKTLPDFLFTAGELRQMDTEKLTGILLGYGEHKAYMSLMMD